GQSHCAGNREPETFQAPADRRGRRPGPHRHPAGLFGSAQNLRRSGPHPDGHRRGGRRGEHPGRHRPGRAGLRAEPHQSHPRQRAPRAAHPRHPRAGRAAHRGTRQVAHPPRIRPPEGPTRPQTQLHRATAHEAGQKPVRRRDQRPDQIPQHQRAAGRTRRHPAAATGRREHPRRRDSRRKRPPGGRTGEKATRKRPLLQPQVHESQPARIYPPGADRSPEPGRNGAQDRRRRHPRRPARRADLGERKRRFGRDRRRSAGQAGRPGFFPGGRRPLRRLRRRGERRPVGDREGERHHPARPHHPHQTDRQRRRGELPRPARQPQPRLPEAQHESRRVRGHPAGRPGGAGRQRSRLQGPPQAVRVRVAGRRGPPPPGRDRPQQLRLRGGEKRHPARRKSSPHRPERIPAPRRNHHQPM
ncbi:MAG: ABC transporter, permease protein, partial [uncultured Cytophagales bacterium]